MKTWMMIKSSIRKNKSSSVTLVLLIMMAVVFLYSSLMVMFDINHVIEDVNTDHAGADFVTVVPRQMTEMVENVLSSLSGYDHFEKEDTVSCYGTIQNKRVEEKAQNQGLIFLNQDVERSISTISVLEADKEQADNSVILPYSLKQTFGYQTGDEIEINLNGIKRTFRIYGFLQDVLFATPANIDQYILYIRDSEFMSLYQEVTEVMRTSYLKVRLESGYSSEDYESAFTKKMTTIKGVSDGDFLKLNYEKMKVGTTATINIVTVILIIFSLLMLFISLIVIRFTIITHIEEDAKNIGSMEAAGFTSRMIRKALVLQFVLLASIGAVSGLVIAVAISNVVTTIVSASIGLYWKAVFSGKAAVTSLLLIYGFVILIAGKASARLKRITPIVALRNGLSNYNFKKNYLPLEHSSGNLNLLLGVKQMLHARKQNISIGLIGFIMAFTFIMGLMMLTNFTGENPTLMKLVGMEKADIAITCENKEQRDQVRKKLEEYGEVDHTLLFKYATLVVEANGEEVSICANVCDDFSQLEVKTVFEGRYPEHENEIVLSNSNADKLGVGVGDVVSVKGKDGNKEYIVVGLNQHINHLGSSCSVTEQGMIRSNSSYATNMIYLYLKKGIDGDRFINTLVKSIGVNGLSYTNMATTFESSLRSIADITKIICIVLDAVVVLVVAIILFYMVKVKLIHDKKIIGIQKAMGFTTKQLIVQNVISFCSIMLASFLMGALAIGIFSTPLCTLMFSVANFKKCSLELSMTVVFGSIIGLTIFSVLVTGLVSLRIRKVNPRELFME